MRYRMPGVTDTLRTPPWHRLAAAAEGVLCTSSADMRDSITAAP
jgi:hypothetical protein